MKFTFFRVKAQPYLDDLIHPWGTPGYMHLNPYIITHINLDYCHKHVIINLINGSKYKLDMDDFFQIAEIIDIPLVNGDK